jgi:hypothetical protein
MAAVPNHRDSATGRGDPLLCAVLQPRFAFAAFGVRAEVVGVAVGWCMRYGLSGRDVDELFAVASIRRRLAETVAPDPGDALAQKCREDP